MFTSDPEVVQQLGSDLFEELSIPFLCDIDPETWGRMRDMFAAGYMGGFAAGQADVVTVLNRINPLSPGDGTGPTERQ